MKPDVCLLLEGTYPFVAGGVSSWVHALIGGLPDVSFSLVHLGATPNERYEPKYELPPNVVDLTQIFIQDRRPQTIGTPHRLRRSPRNLYGSVHDFHKKLVEGDGLSAYREMCAALAGHSKRSSSVADLLYSRQSWDMLCRLYDESGEDSSFVDYFWTWRYTHLPLFQILNTKLPEAKVYHTVSTGYAGLLGAVAHDQTGRPLVVTEHGIYTHERALEIAQAEWIYVKDHSLEKVERTQSFFKKWWTNMFRFMSSITYSRAELIITITGVNQPYQIEDGADRQKLMVIPNGVDLERFARLRSERTGRDGEFCVGFVGRVVAIKDVKTFIKAIKIAASQIPGLQAFIVGPTEEDEEYYEECCRLTTTLGLDGVITYTGRADVSKYYPKFDVVVLTSMSEAQPLVILEAHAAGIPVVASEVGACSEMLFGRDSSDRALGPSGILTPVASPAETAAAVVKLFREPAARRAMSEAGMTRVERFYRKEDLNKAYLEIYRKLAQQESRGSQT